MERNEAVNRILGDSIGLTVIISLFTVLFTWAVALPIGIYSAVRRYTAGDYVLTLVGFVGMSIPPFLFALVLMYVSGEYFGVSVSGLFSVRYAADPTWSWGKWVDLLQHVWVPVVVLGTGSTAVMIRVMRANLLDELKRPYVVAARAKGVRPLRLLFKYPVRLALNPFVSGLGGLFPALISGGAIVALVLSLPTIGPMLMLALVNEDTYFAASMLMVLSVLGVIGTLVSDLLLLWLDPRIRLGGRNQ
jgi:ABC-type dipeptide/oligopeptide/nickel transport system permease component